MTNRLVELLNLTSTVLLDIDAEHRLLVGSDETGSVQLSEIGADGVPRQLADFGQPANGRYLPGTRTVIASVDDGGTERTQLWTIDAADPQAVPVPLVSDPQFIHSLLGVHRGFVYYSTNRRNGVDFDIIEREVSTGLEKVRYDGGGWFADAAISPDGRWVVLSRLTLIAASTELLLVDTALGAVDSITDATVPGDWSGPRWLPDSSALIARSDAGAEFISIRRFDLASRTWTTVLAEEGADLGAWPSPDGRWWAVTRSVDGADEVSLYPVADGLPGGRAVLLTLPDVGVVGYRSDVVFAPGSDLLGLTYASPVDPPEVYVWTESAGLHRRTESNPLSSTEDLVQASSHRVPTPDGELIPVLALTPVRPDGSAVIVIHGGPEGASVRSWNPVAAALAVAGHTVVLPNVRGSSGYGRRWLAADDIGKRLDSVADLAAIHDWLPALEVDPARVALYGGSYGGYMVLAGLTFQPDLWSAGVDIVGMSSLTTFLENTSPYRRAYREREYGSLAEHRDVLEAASPLNRISELRAPLFIIHGANDPRVPLSEAEQVAAAVRANGADCELLVYGDEGHGLAKRVNRLDAYPQVLAFLSRHLG
jgi:dipeptidyl aminopeptidase/acylaminoacyl peptidase